MSRTYRITFTPVDKFFFGSEKTFGVGGNENYLIRSERFPQQTTILGTLRKAILDQCRLIDYRNNGKITDKEAAVKLIGARSFHLDSSDSKIDFGIIRSLSPVFLMKEKERYFPCPLDYGFILGAETGEAVFVNCGGKREQIPKLDGYDPKTGLERKWISDSGKTVSENEIFQESPQPGVWKGGTGEEDEQGYYKQYFYKLKDGWRFAVYVQLNESRIPKDLKHIYGESLQTTLVAMGKERSQFRMEVTPVKEPTCHPDDCFFPAELKLHATVGPWQKIIFLSDAFVDNQIYNHSFYSITETIDFRFIQTSVQETTMYANLTEDNNKPKQVRKSQKFNLIKRGSVLYVKPGNISDVVEVLDNPRFRQIGYNFYGVISDKLSPPLHWNK